MHVRVCKTHVSECGHICAMLYMWRSEVSYQESLLSSHNNFHKPNLGSSGLGRSTFTHWAISLAFYFILWGRVHHWTWNFLCRLDGLAREHRHQPFYAGVTGACCSTQLFMWAVNTWRMPSGSRNVSIQHLHTGSHNCAVDTSPAKPFPVFHCSVQYEYLPTSRSELYIHVYTYTAKCQWRYSNISEFPCFPSKLS